MDRHRNLYKDNSRTLLTPLRESRHQQKIQDMYESRAKQRTDMYCNGRNLSLSPSSTSSMENAIPKPSAPENVKNCQTFKKVDNVQEVNSSQISKKNLPAAADDKMSRKEAYLKRFLEWKAAKKKEENDNTQRKRQPFVPVVGSLDVITRKNCTSSVPKKKKFNAPLGLKKPSNQEPPTTETSEEKKKNRNSIYLLVETPPKKSEPLPTARAGPKVSKPVLYNKKTKNLDQAIRNIRTKELQINKKEDENSAKPSNVACLNNIVKSGPESKLDVKVVSKPLPSANTNKNILSKKPASKKVDLAAKSSLVTPIPIATTLIKPRLLKFKEPELKPTSVMHSNGDIKKSGRQLRFKNINNNVKTVRNQVTSSNLSVNLKAKKKPTVSSGAAAKIREMKIQIIATENKKDLPEIYTPLDFIGTNSFDTCITSTQNNTNKSHKLQQPLEMFETISPIEILSKQNSADAMITSNGSSPKAHPLKIEEKNKKTQTKNIFNFVRYSEMNVTNLTPPDEGVKKEETLNQEIVSSPKTEQLVTPERKPEDKENRPINYMSPFVSVSRGKVSSRKEKEKRNSIYLQSADENVSTKETETAAVDTISIEARRSLETVRYFREQLNDEVERLETICNRWDTYKTDNLDKLQEVGGEDMIDVAIGQTKLLIRSKFKQFTGLIDRCEAGALGKAAVEDGSEKTRIINPEDLEGFFFSMIKSQIENVDKRFANLDRWKANNWIDPDEIKSKPKTKGKKSKNAGTGVGATAKANTKLVEMLRQIRKNKMEAANKGNADADVILTPTRKGKGIDVNHHNSPRRRSVVVKDRKSFSQAATVLKISTPPHRRMSRSNDSPTIKNLDASKYLLKTALLADQKRQQSVNPVTPIKEEFLSPGTSKNGRKSILKTPGTAKGKQKNVVFNDKLHVRKFTFAVNDEGDGDEIEDQQIENNSQNSSGSGSFREKIEESGERTYSLRTRKVKLRPSCEIVIP